MAYNVRLNIEQKSIPYTRKEKTFQYAHQKILKDESTFVRIQNTPVHKA
jgi:hypothetical protein